MTNQYTILCVDDEQNNLDALYRNLRREYNVLTALSGAEGLDILHENEISLIISDQRMPHMTGAEFLEKSLAVKPDCIRIILTGFTEVDDLMGAINNGRIFQYITKPWSPESLLPAIKKALEFLELSLENKRLIAELEERVEQRTIELKRAIDELQEANERLLELDKMKSSFVSQVSHDLRTPLTAIKFSMDNLKMGIAGEMNDKQMKLIDRTLKSIHRLENLVNDVLDMNRLESGRMVLDVCPFDLCESIHAIYDENLPAAKQKEITVSLSGLDQPVRINADAGKLQRVIGELIGNAIKYTPENGTVELSLQCTDQQASLMVKDSGIGMSPDDCAKIWERFYRVESAKAHAKGTGLGLSIAKELVEMHGGSICVESELGNGTTFILSLPFKAE